MGLWVLGQGEAISTHVPRAGDDLKQRAGSGQKEKISTHVPRAGDD